jgi:hypothetical protein
METGTVKRAFQLASECSTLDEIRARLKREGYSNVTEHLSGNVIRKDLSKLLRAAE